MTHDAKQIDQLMGELEIFYAHRHVLTKDLDLKIEIHRKEIEVLEKKKKDRVQGMEPRIRGLEEEVKKLVLAQGRTMRSEGITATYYKPTVRWKTEELMDYAKRNPEIMSFRVEGQPRVQIKIAPRFYRKYSENNH